MNFQIFASNSYIPLILEPSRITSHICSNFSDPDIILGNQSATISDHLPQFAVIPNIFGNISGNKPNIYERYWSNFDRENFILDYFSVNLEDLLKIDELNAGDLAKIYLDKINMQVDTYACLKKINKYKLKFKSKPQITLGLQKSVSVKNELLTYFISKKTLYSKRNFTLTKKYRNLLSTLTKKSKQAYYDEYFERNWNNIKNTWKGIKLLISLKTGASILPTVLSLDNDIKTNPYDIANSFNNYFTSIAEI